MKFSRRPDYRPQHETAKTKTQTVNRQSTSEKATDRRSIALHENGRPKVRAGPTVTITSINIAGSVVHLSDTVTTLGVYLDQTLNLQRHVNSLCLTTTSALFAISEPLCQMISA